MELTIKVILTIAALGISGYFLYVVMLSAYKIGYYETVIRLNRNKLDPETFYKFERVQKANWIVGEDKM